MPLNLSLALHAVAHCTLVPPGLLVLLLALGLLLAPRRPALGRGLAWTGTLLLLLFSLSPVAQVLTQAAGNFEPIPAASRGAAQAIVILAAEARSAPEYDEGYSVGDLTLERLRYGARLARQTGLPMLLSGGRFRSDAAPSLAELMQTSLHEDFGLDAKWLETRSRNTRENAQLSAQILKPAGVITIILVTEDNHMRRARNEFVANGIGVIAAPVRVPATGFDDGWAAFCPSLSALRNSTLAIYELLGQAEQWLVPPPTSK